MAEYISRNDAYFAAGLIALSSVDRKITCGEVQKIMNSIPNANVVEVDRKNGKWIQTDALPHHVYCSVCHKTYIPNSEWRIWENGELPRDFCPNCGADMRGVDNG